MVRAAVPVTWISTVVWVAAPAFCCGRPASIQSRVAPVRSSSAGGGANSRGPRGANRSARMWNYMFGVIAESLESYEARAGADAAHVGVNEAVVSLLRIDPALSAAAIADRPRARSSATSPA